MSPLLAAPEWFTRLYRRFNNRALIERLESDPALRAAYERVNSVDPRGLLARPITESRFVVLDTETTGYGAYAGDEIVAVAMLELRGLEPTGREFHTLVNPQRPIPPESTAIHGIGDAQVRDAPSIGEVIGAVLEFIDDGVLVGHHTNFDVRFLNKTLNRLLGSKLRNPVLDTMLMYLGHSGRMGHYSLEEVAQYCRVDVTGRHTAHGDALTTARLFQCLAPRLADPARPVSFLLQQQDTNEP